MKRLLAAVVILAALAVLIVIALKGSGAAKETSRSVQPSVSRAAATTTTTLPPTEIPVVAAAVERAAVRLPDSAVLIAASDRMQFKGAFHLREEPTAANGREVMLLDGAGDGKGEARFEVELSAEKDYAAWVRARWRDSCGNSLALMVDGVFSATVGQDAVYGAWHWLRAGGPRGKPFHLGAGKHTVAVLEREDGIEFDEILFVPDGDFIPSGIMGGSESGPELRTFADDFSRSPGHGMEAWDLRGGKWEVAFSFDPNRVPNQYALVAKAEGGAGAAFVKGPAWKDCHMVFSLSPTAKGLCGAVVDAPESGAGGLRVGFDLTGEKASLRVTGEGIDECAPLGNDYRLGQWHRVEVLRWGWSLRVTLDEKDVFTTRMRPVASGAIGFFIDSGEAVFDDLEITSVPHQLDDGRRFKIAWTPVEQARWFRPAAADSPEALIGRSGALRTSLGNLPVAEAWVDQDGLPGVRCGMALEEKGACLSLDAKSGETRLRRAAVRYRYDLPDSYLIEPYHFTHGTIEDTADYMDFTPEEMKAMASGPDANVNRRVPRIRPMLGVGRSEYSPWEILKPSWRLQSGVLVGQGAGALLRHAQSFGSLLDVRFRARLAAPASAAEVELYAGPEPGLRLRLAATTPAETDAGVICLSLPADGAWADVALHVEEYAVTATVGKTPPVRLKYQRGDGDEIFLRVLSGTVEFDDIEIAVPERAERTLCCRFVGDSFDYEVRATKQAGEMDRPAVIDKTGAVSPPLPSRPGHGFLYPFDRREPDWWREGGPWIDHAGMACALASSWIALAAPKADGMLWNKRTFASDALVAFNVLENSEWFGWGREHHHYPYDNICAVLGVDRAFNSGYRIEVNSRNRTATVLYRNGKEVASVAQDASFPIRYAGHHAPYWPRRNRISLVKRGDTLRAIVNGKAVLTWKDPAPLSVRYVGVGGYATRINFANIEVRSLGGQPPPAQH